MPPMVEYEVPALGDIKCPVCEAPIWVAYRKRYDTIEWRGNVCKHFQPNKFRRRADLIPMAIFEKEPVHADKNDHQEAN